jgi:hypothetical protein
LETGLGQTRLVGIEIRRLAADFFAWLLLFWRLLTEDVILCMHTTTAPAPAHADSALLPPSDSPLSSASALVVQVLRAMSLLELFLSTLSADPNVRKLAELRLDEVPIPASQPLLRLSARLLTAVCVRRPSVSPASS